MPRRNDEHRVPQNENPQRPESEVSEAGGGGTREMWRPKLVLRRVEEAGDPPSPPGHPAARVVVVSDDRFWRARVAAATQNLAVGLEVVGTGSAAREWMRCFAESGSNATALLIIDIGLADVAGGDIAQEAKERGLAAMLACPSPSLDDAVVALRAGASDLITRTMAMRDLSRRIEAALDRAVSSRRQEQRIVRLKRICRRLRLARQQVARQVDSLCTDLVHAYQELAEHMNQVTTASEFGSLIRQELDLEALLRTTLEFILAKTGPTNAAVFLPATSGDFSLGAYVNYDCPKETIDILLDHMANAVAPRFEHVGTIEHLTEQAQLDRYMAGDAQWIGDSHMVAFSCRHEGECLAIFLLFRDRKMPYADGLLPQMKTVRDLFAQQLARVIKIHHRHLPKEKWGAIGDMDEPRGDDYGLAA